MSAVQGVAPVKSQQQGVTIKAQEEKPSPKTEGGVSAANNEAAVRASIVDVSKQ